MIRAFLAVPLSERLRNELAALQTELKRRMALDLPREASLSWVRPAALHLTIKFLGDIDERLVEPLQETLRQVLTLHCPIDVPILRLGVFPRLQQPRVLWVGPPDQWEKGEDAARLALLHRSIDEGCVSLNLAPDMRPLSAHLTLARVKAGERSVGQFLARIGAMEQRLAFDPIRVNMIVLIQSDLKPTGSIYTTLWEAPLVA
jgi:2'-5' RNA ligase